MRASASTRVALTALMLGALTGSPALAAETATLTVTVDGLVRGLFDDTALLNAFGCKGGNRSPPLHWTSPPPDTRSLVVMLYDRDAPTGSGLWHWVLYNLPPTLQALPRGVSRLPGPGLQGRTDFGTHAYSGPCPPPGDPPHRYEFTVWALDVDTLPVPADASPAIIGYFARQHAVAAGRATVLYGRVADAAARATHVVPRRTDLDPHAQDVPTRRP